MTKNRKVYSCQVHSVLLANTNLISLFSIQAPNRRFRIKSIYWDVYIINAAGEPLNPYTQITQRCSINLGLGIPLVTSLFIPGSGTAFNQNGDNIQLNKPGQVIFDSWFVQHALYCSYFGVNTGAVTYEHFTTVIIETEEET